MHPLPGFQSRVASSYARQDIVSSAPLGLVARLYELAIGELARARVALATRNWAAKGAAVRRAGEYLSLLQCSLSRDEGGDVAANLDRLYTYMLVRLSEAHLNNDDVGFEEIGRHLTELGAAWRQAAERERSAPAVGSASEPVTAAAR